MSSRGRHIVIVLIAVILAIGAYAYVPIRNFQREKHAVQLAAEFQRPQADIPALLPAIQELDHNSQAIVLHDGHDPIISYFAHQAEDAIDEDKGRYDFAAATQAIAAADRYYPDSAELLLELDSIYLRKNRLIAKLRAQCEAGLRSGKTADLADKVKLLRSLDPDNPVLKDPKLAGMH